MELLQCLQAGGVDEIKSGQIDDQAHIADRMRIKLAIKQRGGRLVKDPCEPHDRRRSPILPANRQLTSRDRLTVLDNRVGCASEVPPVGLRTRQHQSWSRGARHRLAGRVQHEATFCAAAYV